MADWRLCVAPMIDVTDRHCRYFHRLLAPQARLYTEMITTGALLRGDAERHLDYDAAEHPVALQLGGSEPDALAQAARLGARWGYDEINLNCGCPSERVQRGAFGACLMAEPQLVADCVRAMQDAVSVPVTVKHRLGLDYDESYDFVRDFVGVLFEAGCRVFIVHARNAVLKGLSPKDNREKPPLRYAEVLRLRQDFPDAVIVLNGGLANGPNSLAWMQDLDGVMLGRAAWHHPDILAQLNRHLTAQATNWSPDLAAEQPEVDQAVLDGFMAYAEDQYARGVPMHILVRGLLGWRMGKPGARQWRRQLSDPAALRAGGPALLRRAWDTLQAG
ncbi:tRNA dihydrouridine(20/20a) synthase DusA [Castellaniella sp.]|uniref:tRNA dihydrouridine(20/20a) synthase DusA n=1 Tax=Castellaniella sp. TaxID=1955812 RepID=UPI002AFFA5D1|nr:tRNA dihydrouridine(20/20a) synthase DusA [Castellaniella sp.]